MPLETYAKNLMLDALPNTVYAALFTGGAPGVGTEASPLTLWGSASRPAVTLEAASDGSRDPNGDAALGTLQAASVTVTHVGYYTAATGGTLLGYTDFARTLLSGDSVKIPDASAAFSITD
jgi:hypothetical protein